MGNFRVTGGPGVRTMETPHGTMISFDGRAAFWDHAFRVSLSGKAATVRPGEVNGKVPTIGGVSLDDGPRLEWKAPALDAAGRGYIALEATLGKEWEVLSAEILQVAFLDDAEASSPIGYRSGAVITLPGRRARHPLARLRLRDNGLLTARQVTHFDLTHRVFVLDEAKSQARHFFSAVP